MVMIRAESLRQPAKALGTSVVRTNDQDMLSHPNLKKG